MSWNSAGRYPLPAEISSYFCLGLAASLCYANRAYARRPRRDFAGSGVIAWVPTRIDSKVPFNRSRRPIDRRAPRSRASGAVAHRAVRSACDAVERDNTMTVPGEKIALFIDGANLYATAKSLGFDIDYKKLLREFQSRGYLLRAFYYTAVIEDQEYSSIRPLIDWLDYNGYSVVTKATKEFVDQTGRRKVKGNMDIELAVDAMEIADTIDHMVLFSGDGDFRSLVEAVQRKGVRVTVVSTISTQPPMVADELRRQADIFTRHRHAAGARSAAIRPSAPPREPRGPRDDARARHHTPQFLQRPADAATRRRRRRAATTTRNSTISQRAAHAAAAGKPGRDCPLCPRLVAFRKEWRAKEPDWFNAPVPSFGPRRRARC